MNEPVHSDAVQILYGIFYSPSTGLAWSIRRKAAREIAAKEGSGYIAAKNHGAVIKLHRAAWTAINGPIPADMVIDHINNDRQDNRLSNLRLVTKGENTRKFRKNSRNTSGLTGVFASGKRWSAIIKSDGSQRRIGTFDDRETAYLKYIERKIEAHGLLSISPLTRTEKTAHLFALLPST